MDRLIDPKTLLHTAKVTSILPSTLLAGYCLAFSQNGVSQLYNERPHTSVPLFKRIFLTGTNVAIPLPFISALSSGYLAYTLPAQRRLWAIAAVAAVAVRPWTGLVMMPGIKRLMALASADKGVLDKSEQTLEHRQLMTRWVKQNFVRTAVLLVGSVAGLWATVTA